MRAKTKCPECNSERVWKKGTTPTRKGKRVRYVCTECGRTFYGTEKVEAFKKPRKPGSAKQKKGK